MAGRSEGEVSRIHAVEKRGTPRMDTRRIKMEPPHVDSYEVHGFDSGAILEVQPTLEPLRFVPQLPPASLRA
ncbi:MAG TPA: hypothetical protein DCE44_02090 [Verrucomicrobiales bacterium]|nr:hypothetical protein [Verrucomicrobiales bacterium]